METGPGPLVIHVVLIEEYRTSATISGFQIRGSRSHRKDPRSKLRGIENCRSGFTPWVYPAINPLRNVVIAG
jgi:hypothetical protein